MNILLRLPNHPGLIQLASWWQTYQVDPVSSHPKKLKKKLQATFKHFHLKAECRNGTEMKENTKISVRHL
jgi:uncharacterized protein Usg